MTVASQRSWRSPIAQCPGRMVGKTRLTSSHLQWLLIVASRCNLSKQQQQQNAHKWMRVANARRIFKRFQASVIIDTASQCHAIGLWWKLVCSMQKTHPKVIKMSTHFRARLTKRRSTLMWIVAKVICQRKRFLFFDCTGCDTGSLERTQHSWHCMGFWISLQLENPIEFSNWTECERNIVPCFLEPFLVSDSVSHDEHIVSLLRIQTARRYGRCGRTCSIHMVLLFQLWSQRIELDLLDTITQCLSFSKPHLFVISSFAVKSFEFWICIRVVMRSVPTMSWHFSVTMHAREKTIKSNLTTPMFPIVFVFCACCGPSWSAHRKLNNNLCAKKSIPIPKYPSSHRFSVVPFTKLDVWRLNDRK